MASRFTGKKARRSALSLLKKGEFEKSRVVLREALDRLLYEKPKFSEEIFIDLGTIYFIEFFINNKLGDQTHSEISELSKLVPRLEGRGDDGWCRVARSYLLMVSLVTERMPGLARLRGMEALGISKKNTNSYASILLVQAFVYKQLSIVIQARDYLDTIAKSPWAKNVRGEKQGKRSSDISLMTLLTSEILRAELERSYGDLRKARKSISLLIKSYTPSEMAIFRSRNSQLTKV